MRRIVSDLHQTDGPSACVFFRLRFAYSLQTGLTQAKGGYITLQYFHSITPNLLRLDHPPARKKYAWAHRCLRWGDTDASNTTRFCVSGSAGTGRSGSPSPTCGRLASVFARGLAQPIDQFKYLIVGQVCSYALDEHCGWVRGSFGGSRSGCFVSPRVFSSRGNPCGVVFFIAQ